MLLNGHTLKTILPFNLFLLYLYTHGGKYI